jgi:alpha-tubulin suppressor-like RCC1 family protein
MGINTVGVRYYSSPVQVGALTNWKSVWAGFNDFAYAISNTGALWCWGGSGSNAGNNFSLPISTQNVYYSSPVQVGALTNWKSVVDYFAIKTDGTLWAWGNNSLGVLGNNNRTSYSSPIQIGALTNWKQISMNSNITAAAVKTDGTLWTWGANIRGSLGQGFSTFNLYYSSPVQVGSLTNWKQVACGVQGATLAVKTDGTLWGWGWGAGPIFGTREVNDRFDVYYNSPIQIGSLTNWKSVSMWNQTDTAYAIKTDGSLWFLGFSAFGESGTGDAVVKTLTSPPGIRVGALTTWKQVSGGQYFTVGIQDGTI